MRRHLTGEEREFIRRLVDDGGLVELIRLVGTIIGNDIGDIDKANNWRSRLMKVAMEVSNYEEDKQNTL